MAEERPRFRRDLVATLVEADGIAYIETTDPRTGAAFRFYDFEHAVAESLDGRPLTEVVPGARERSGLELTLEQLSVFVKRLAELGFIENGQGAEPEAAAAAVANEAPTGYDVTARARAERDPAEAGDTEATIADREIEAEPESEEPDLEAFTHSAPTSAAGEIISPGPAALDAPEMAPASTSTDGPTGSGEPEAPAEPDALAALIAEVASSPPPIGTPQRPLTVEEAMPPVLPEGFAANGASAREAILEPIPPLTETAADEPAPSVSATSAAAEPAPAPRPVRETLEPTLAVPRARSPVLLYAGLGLLTAAAVGFGLYRLLATSEPPPVSVHTVTASPGAVYRWFEAVGTVKATGDRTLPFASPGKVVEVRAAGTAYQAGDVLAELDGASKYKALITHNRERLAHYEQLLESSRADGNHGEEHQAELKVAEKKRLIAEAQAGYAREAVIAPAAGELAETLVKVGAQVKPGTAAVRTKGNEWRAELELSRDDADRLRHLGFCHVEIDGKPLDCTLSAEGGDETHVAIDLPANDPAVAAGKPVRVARARYDGVMVLPASALVPSKGSDRRVLVARDGRAESYAVVLADQSPTEIVVVQGLEPGSTVIVDAPGDLRAGAAVAATAAPAPAKP